MINPSADTQCNAVLAAIPDNASHWVDEVLREFQARVAQARLIASQAAIDRCTDMVPMLTKLTGHVAGSGGSYDIVTQGLVLCTALTNDTDSGAMTPDQVRITALEDAA